MAPPKLAASIRLYVVGLNGTPAGRESDLITEVRGRFNSKWTESASDTDQDLVYMFGLEPITKYLMTSLGSSRAASLSRGDFGVHVYELYKIASARTRIGKRFAGLTDSDERWANVEACLQMQLQGAAATVPQTGSASSSTPVT